MCSHRCVGKQNGEMSRNAYTHTHTHTHIHTHTHTEDPQCGTHKPSLGVGPPVRACYVTYGLHTHTHAPQTDTHIYSKKAAYISSSVLGVERPSTLLSLHLAFLFSHPERGAFFVFIYLSLWLLAFHCARKRRVCGTQDMCSG